MPPTQQQTDEGNILDQFTQPREFTPQSETEPTLPTYANEIIDLIPDHTTYIETHAARGTLIGHKPPSRNEVINDKHGDILHLYETIRAEKVEIIRFLAESIIDSDLKSEWRQTYMRGYRHSNDVIRAAQFFTLFANPTVTNDVYDSEETIEAQLDAFRKRSSDVLIEDKPAHEIIESYASEDACVFLNPAYYADRYEYAEYDCDCRFIEYLAECQGAGGEYVTRDGATIEKPYWMLLTQQSPMPVSMLPTQDFGEDTLTRNHTLGMNSVSAFSPDNSEKPDQEQTLLGIQETAP